MPPWAKTGPVTARNYNYRAEEHCAAKSFEREGMHPTISLESPEFPLWLAYFDSLPGGRPYPFVMLVRGEIREMTVPEQIPQWFDSKSLSAEGRLTSSTTRLLRGD